MKLEFAKYVGEKRLLDVHITCEDEQTLRNVCDYIEENVEDVETIWDTVMEENDGFSVIINASFEYGLMSDMKKDIRKAYNEAKKIYK